MRETSRGSEALRICEGEDHGVDLVISDIVMPFTSARLLARVRDALGEAVDAG